MENTFLDKNYETPKSSSNYFKFQEGDNRFRILGSSITGWEYFRQDNKPVRSKEPFDSTPDIKKGGVVKHFWAFPIWNYQLSMVQVMEITQSSIKDPIMGFIKNPKWGDVFQYDLCVIKSGEGMETRYQVQAEPPIGEVSDEIKNAYMEKPINLEALFEGEDPFKV